MGLFLHNQLSCLSINRKSLDALNSLPNDRYLGSKETLDRQCPDGHRYGITTFGGLIHGKGRAPNGRQHEDTTNSTRFLLMVQGD